MPTFYKKIHRKIAELKFFKEKKYTVNAKELYAFAIFKLIEEVKGGVVIVLEDAAVVDSLSTDLLLYVKCSEEKREVLEFPEYTSGSGLFQPGNDSDRHAILGRLCSEDDDFLILTTSSGYIGPVSDPDTFRKSALEFTVGSTGMGPEEYAALLVEMDYDNEFQVTLPGEFARRGGILDIFSPMYKEACRVEFFGDEIESIRTFDPTTQKSLEEIHSFKAVPSAGAELETGSFMDYCEGYTTLLVGSQDIYQHVKQYFGDSGDELLARNLEQSCEVKKIELSDLSESSLKVSALAPLYRSSLPETSGAVSMLHRQFAIGQLTKWTTTGCQVFIFCGSKGNRQRLEQLLKEHKEIDAKNIVIDEASLSYGLFLQKSRTVLLSENEIFGRAVTVRKHKSGRQQALEAFLEEEPEINSGDYAVHVSYGICRYEGIEFQQNGGVSSEVMVLEFADERKLYVPLDSAHLVSRYIGGRKGVPTLTRLGGTMWRNARAKAIDAASDLASDLLRMQAARKHSRGHRYAPDNEWQQMFEDSFPYKETVDQLKAIEDVKKDMESPRPMDRLICGDVGFGKTEVALRAAFKSVMDGRQVGIIVPTTVLAQQHFKTFSQRMADYPIDIRLLCRFVSAKKQRKTLEDMALGSCDIVIGTHRLLQKDIEFGRLGLLIVDEEQRFGVEDKERLKRLRTMVDILTMTATPIPRTLYFSLAGLKDFSTIMTPPVERKPVRTIVAEEDDEVIRQAILREIERGGQVFFLHNRVQTIEKRAFYIQQLVPEARVTFGHGQMKDRQLEKVMQELLEHKCDVFVSTTIIESGLDNPRANTMIMDRADRFGLSELYQLRGRVGRHHLQAYCYLLLPKGGLLMDTARQRLSAIRRYTHLGAGFKLALRDLEIRGAGNLLGKEQSGHIAAVGFDMYCKLLKKSVDKLENNSEEEDVDVHVSFDFMPLGVSAVYDTACLLPEFIGSEQVRLEIYKRSAALKDRKALKVLKDELRDRFGAFPVEVKRYFIFQEIRLQAQKSGLHTVSCREGRLYLEDEKGYRKIMGKVPRLTEGTTLKKLAEVKAIIIKAT